MKFNTFVLLLALSSPVFADPPRAEIVDAPIPVVAQTVPTPPASVQYVLAPQTAGQPVIVQAAPVAAPTDATPWWLQILTAPAVVTMIASLAVFLLKWLHDKKGLETDRWSGLVCNLYGAAEKAGVLDNWSGRQKLDFAMGQFAEQFRQTFGYDPTGQDYQDARNDLARVALADKPALGVQDVNLSPASLPKL